MSIAPMKSGAGMICKVCALCSHQWRGSGSCHEEVSRGQKRVLSLWISMDLNGFQMDFKCFKDASELGGDRMVR